MGRKSSAKSQTRPSSSSSGGGLPGEGRRSFTTLLTVAIIVIALVVIAATLASFNIPEAGLLLIIGIDQFLDMGRSATNVIGNTLATAAIAKWEGEKVDIEELEAALTPKPA